MDKPKKLSNISKLFRKVSRGETTETTATKALYQLALESGLFGSDEDILETVILDMTPEEQEEFHLLLLEDQRRVDEMLGKSLE